MYSRAYERLVEIMGSPMTEVITAVWAIGIVVAVIGVIMALRRVIKNRREG